MGNQASSPRRSARGYSALPNNALFARTQRQSSATAPTAPPPPAAAAAAAAAAARSRPGVPPVPHEASAAAAAAAAMRRRQIAGAADARRKKKTPAGDAAKAKLSRNLDLVFDEEKRADVDDAALKTCMLCGTRFRSQTSLNTHLKLEHQHTPPSQPLLPSAPAHPLSDEDYDILQVIHSHVGTLLSNDSSTIESTMRLLRGVFKNIVKHASSGHLKYRKLRLANASVHQSIVCVPGVLDVLQAIGFVQADFPGPDGRFEPHLFYGPERPLRNIELALLSIEQYLVDT